ncbi:hypothetical protein EV191_101541 [Tamaricihabitans halophyticus]|uniref:PPE family protein n=1 Tax=Tamaricihabitans halophyticus TaxID=1262583 RepID=A0A4R2R4H2_9PSEU|nr:hypothetical protein [Tamaricihabitans halophyticus]TCP56598.1 hypothetical protein EV191_101541 [Tamaricihabitans halophyticus]
MSEGGLFGQLASAITGISGPQLAKILKAGPGTGAMDAAREVAREQQQVQTDVNDIIARVAGKIESGWQGSAAEGANSVTKPLIQGSAEASDSLGITHSLHENQGASFSQTVNSMHDLPDNPPETGVWDSMTPWDTDTEKAVSEHNAKAQENVERYQRYSDFSDDTGFQAPTQFPRYAGFGGDISMAPSASSEPVGDTSTALPETNSPGTTTTAGFSSTPTAGTPGGVPPATGNPGVSPVGGTPGVSGGPGPAGPGAPGSVTGVGPTQGASPAAAGYNSPATSAGGGRVPGMGMAPLMGGGAAGAGGDTTRSGRGFGARGGVAGGPGGSAAGRLTGGPGASGGTPGAGAKTGAGPGGAAAAESAAKTGAAGSSTGRGGMAGGPMAGGQRGKGSQDEDHERKTWLVEPDKEGTFGTDEMTAPPVIGENPNPPR